jgi:hypothetical protein
MVFLARHFDSDAHTWKRCEQKSGFSRAAFDLSIWGFKGNSRNTGQKIRTQAYVSTAQFRLFREAL